jgi:hypothetical protein
LAVQSIDSLQLIKKTADHFFTTTPDPSMTADHCHCCFFTDNGGNLYDSQLPIRMQATPQGCFGKLFYCKYSDRYAAIKEWHKYKKSSYSRKGITVQYPIEILGLRQFNACSFEEKDDEDLYLFDNFDSSKSFTSLYLSSPCPKDC